MKNSIYKITNGINGKVYIGKTSKTIQQRFKEHIIDSRKNRCHKRPLYDAFSKYGIENFSIELIETDISDEDINTKEIYYINKFNSYIGFDNSNGYNATLGGDSKKYKNIDINAMIRDYNSGLTLKEIGIKHQIDYTYVSDLLKANNVDVKSSIERHSKPILQIDINTNAIIEKFESATVAAIKLFGNKNKRHNINKALLNSQASAFGYKWRFCE